MSKIKEAYEQFMSAILEETGCVPSVQINFHSTSNEVLSDDTQALKVAALMSQQLETSAPEYAEEASNRWYSVHDYGRGINFAVFMPKQGDCIENYEHSYDDRDMDDNKYL